MTIYYLMIEAIPNHNNPERNQFGGAYINCWVKASTEKDALKRAKEYINEEDWMYIKTEDIWLAQRQLYTDMPESLECYDEACKLGLSSIFNTWPAEEENNNES